VSCCTKA